MKLLKYILLFLLLINLCTALEIPKLIGRVNDYANLLTQQEQQQLENTLADYERQTSNQLAVLIIPSLAGESLEDYSIRVVDKWKLGQKGKNNGLLLLIAWQEKKIRIEVGYGLEPTVTDAFSGEVIREIIAPAFRQGDYYQGINDAMFAIMKKIGGEFSNESYKPVYSVDHSNLNSVSDERWEGLFVLLIMFGFFARAFGKVTWRRGFLGSIFLPIIIFAFLGIPITLPLLVLLVIFGFPFTFLMILLSMIFGAGRGFYGGGFSSGGSSFGGFYGGGGSFGGGGSSGGW